jgi:hypothetical protein
MWLQWMRRGVLWGAVRKLLGLPSVAEQAELMLNAQKRRASGGQVGLFDMYSRTSEAANKQAAAQAQNYFSSFKQDAAASSSSSTATPAPAKPAESAPIVVSAAARFKKKARG